MGNDVLISIKPKYTHKIALCEKTVELRKKFTKKEVDRVFIYSSSPDKVIIGYFKPKIDLDTVLNLWDKYKEHVSITSEEFYDYYYYHKYGVALVIDELVIFKETVDPYKIFDSFVPPQSFKFLSVYEVNKILK